MSRLLLLAAASLPIILLAAACEQQAVDCEALCAHTLVCEVTFAPYDDIDGAKIASGERTAEEDCALGCGDNPSVTVDSATCVDTETAKSTDPHECQAPVLDCFGAQVAQPTG